MNNFEEAMKKANEAKDEAKKFLEVLKTLEGNFTASDFMAGAATWNYGEKDRAYQHLRGIK